MSKKNRNHKNSKGSRSGMKAPRRDAGLTMNINRLSLHMDERMTTANDDHSFRPIDSSRFCGNDICESHRHDCSGHDRDGDHTGCGFHHPHEDSFDCYADEFMGAPCVDMDELAGIISRKLGIDISIVRDVLMAEEDYLEERGISVPLYDEDEEDDGNGDSEDGCSEGTEAVAEKGTASEDHDDSGNDGAEAQEGDRK